MTAVQRIQRVGVVGTLLLATMLTAACSREAGLAAGTARQGIDTAPWAGTQSKSLAAGWQGSGDATAWNEQMKKRSRGQTDSPNTSP